MTWIKKAAAAAWSWIKKAASKLLQLLIRYPAATLLTGLVVGLAILLMFFGKTIQIGGLLGKLWGRKSDLPKIKQVPPPDRKDQNGVTIKPGESDDKGWVQAPVTTDIKKPGIFDDPDVVVVVHPEKGEVKIPLPTGVSNENVKEVVEIRPNVYEVKRNDKGVDTSEVLEILGVKE